MSAARRWAPMSTPASPSQPDPPEDDLLRPVDAYDEDRSKDAPHDPYAVLRIPAFRSYLLGWFVIVLGGQIQSAAIRWEVYDRTKDAHALGLVGLALALPVLLFSLPFGALADRFDRRKIVLVSTTLTGLAAGTLAVLSHFQAHVYWIYAVLFVSGTAQALDRPARAAIAPNLVPLKIFANAMTWISSAFQVASIAGPAIGGFLVGFSPSACYVFYAVTTLAFTFMLVRLKGDFIPKSSANPKGQLENLIEGIQFVFRTKIIFATILLDLIAVILAGTPYMLPVFCKDILHTPSWGYGVLNTADAIGALAMGMLVAHLPPFRRAGRAMLVSVAGFGVCAILFALSKSFALTFVLLMFMGAFDNISVIVRHTLVNVLSPNAMRGRINAVNNIFIGSSNELGGYRAGSMAAWLGPIPSVLLGGIAAVIATGAVAFSFPQVRALGSLKDIPPADGDGKAH